MRGSTPPIVPPKGSLMPPLTPARSRVQIGRTGSAVGRLVACRLGAHLAALSNFRCTSATQTANLGSEFPIFPGAPLTQGYLATAGFAQNIAYFLRGSPDCCAELSSPRSHGENRGSSPLGSAMISMT